MPGCARPTRECSSCSPRPSSALVPAASAPARIIEIGRTAEQNAPSCPANPCQAVSRTTGYQAKVGTQRGLMQAPADGKIVAWSITLGKPGPRQIRFFNENYGGASQAGISVLKTGTKLFGRVTGRSALQSLQPYFGTTVQFPLGRALNVRKGYLIALTVPSWAPALALGMGNDTSWRASRARDGCQEPGIAVGAARPRRPRAVPLPLSHRAADLHGDDDHDAEAAEAADAALSRRRRSPGRTARTSRAASPGGGRLVGGRGCPAWRAPAWPPRPCSCPWCPWCRSSPCCRLRAWGSPSACRGRRRGGRGGDVGGALLVRAR